MKDLERVIGAITKASAAMHMGLSIMAVDTLAEAAVNALQAQRKDVSDAVDQAAKCNRMIPYDQAKPRTCAKCGLGPCHHQGPGLAPGLGLREAPDAHVQQPIAGTTPTPTSMTPRPGVVWAPGAEQAPKPVQWQIMPSTLGGGTFASMVEVGWEPFSVTESHGHHYLWLRRRVP